MKILKSITLIAGIVFVLAIALLLTSFATSMIPGKSKRERSTKVTGILHHAFGGESTHDISLYTSVDSGNSYYINRGLEHVALADIKALKGKPVDIYYYRHGFSLLDFNNKLRHVTEIRVGDKVIYTELVD
jgi:hypothetical protein